jgi:hypothetical protein
VDTAIADKPAIHVRGQFGDGQQSRLRHRSKVGK